MQLNYANHNYRSQQSIKIFYAPVYAASLGQDCHAYELWHD